MKQPKVYVKSLDRVFEVESIRFDTKVVGIYDEEASIYHYCDFDEVEFIYNTGYRDKNDNYIFKGDILEYRGKATEYYIEKLVVKKDGENELYYLTNKGDYVSRLLNMYDYLVIGNIYENKELLEV
jgi:yopX protein|nr:MAG TPA: YopX protein [Bacteriophage sp.]